MLTLPKFRLPWTSTGAIAALCLVAGSTIGLLVVPRAPGTDEELPITPELLLLGQPLLAATPAGSPEKPSDEKALIGAAEERLSHYLSRTFTVSAAGSPSQALPLSKWGISIDEERLIALIQSAQDPTSPQIRYWLESGPPQVFAADDASAKSGDHSSKSEAGESKTAANTETAAQNDSGLPKQVALPLPLSIDWDKARSHLMAMKERTDRRPSPARFDVRNSKVIPHLDGRALDIEATLLALLDAASSGASRIEARFIEEPASKHSEQLAGLSFDHVLGHFETRYSKADKAKERTYNLRIAAEQLDGTVLFPGEEFDFNGVVGPRDEAHGYQVATVIADGELVDGIGGGTCQISGTLHGAAFFAGLEIVERYPHTRPSSYIKMGMDATVVYPTINFRFRNSFDFPVVLHQIVEDGVVRAEVRGASTDQVVSMIRKIDSAIPYEEVERPDPHMPKGTRVLSQRGIPGFRLHRYRTIRRGNHTVREKWRDIYPPTAQVIRVGTGEPSLRKQHSVGTPEYTADEVLILTLRRADAGEAGDYAENREAGKFGKREWTKEAGMPFWSGD